MAETKKKAGLISHGVAAQNRKARYDYTIKETVEAGMVLKGPEVKSLRHGRATLTEAWAGERDGEMWLFNAYIPEYQGGVLSRFEPRATGRRWCRCRSTSTIAGGRKCCWAWPRGARNPTSGRRWRRGIGSGIKRGFCVTGDRKGRGAAPGPAGA
jgi:hypothetical protein